MKADVRYAFSTLEERTLTDFRIIPSTFYPIRGLLFGSLVFAGLATQALGSIIVFEATGPTPASIASTRDAFRLAVGGGTVAGANGDFGGLRREINWDGVPDSLADPTALPANFFNTTSPRGVVFSTPGSGFLVSSNAGTADPVLFGFSNDFQAFSPQRVFTAINSTIVDVNFFVPGTTTPATTNAFGLIFVDVETSNLTKLEFFDAANTLLFTRFALVGVNQGLSFLGGVDTAGAEISRVRITSGANTIVSNGLLGDPNSDVVVMDDFLFGTPTAASAAPEASSWSLLGCGLLSICWARKALAR